MAVLFSAVTLTADNNQVEFLAAGIPRDSDDLEGWTAYENFMDELDFRTGSQRPMWKPTSMVKVKPSRQRPRKWRISRCELMQTKNSCTTTATNIEDADFTIQWSPDELYGVELEL